MSLIERLRALLDGISPGPWNVQSDGQIWCDDHPIVERLCAGPWGDRAIDITNGNEFLAHHWGTVAGPEATANARLIAEAPERIAEAATQLERRDSEILRLAVALHYAHAHGFEWPMDPLPEGSLARELIERGNA